MDLMCINHVKVDESGKKVIFYKSKIKSLEFYLKKGYCMLQFERNEHGSKLSTRLTKDSVVFSSENLNRI